jgi:phosphoribosylaminoimidazolecarboxamide formyltransferase/IMP cyclohydrolase
MSMRKKYRTALEEQFPEEIRIIIGGSERLYRKKMSLRYGENPHQPAAFYSPAEGHLTVGALRLLKTGKSGLSMTNVEDVNNAMRIVSYFREPACAVMKHVNPSGAAVRNKPGEPLREVYGKARDCDALAAYGSVVGFNTVVDSWRRASSRAAWSTLSRRGTSESWRSRASTGSASGWGTPLSPWTSASRWMAAWCSRPPC